ncbi:nitroreductase/quinone reductase family protein [Nitrosopumilus sp. K4]|uniref:nitroreductase/quinone reductase family protein n=1 Tax=Nitrosopumilus sp. K4 TaxID=2795383 RepID=UPI0020138A5F|nr:nitroreductase/quinone reductase family protein [Nitrosopumilus sp. K4]
MTATRLSMTIDEDLFRPILTTKGRKTGNPHSVMLRAVKYNEKIYFSRHRPDGDWFKNAVANPEVIIEYKGTKHIGNAKEVKDEELSKKISELKYPGEQRAKEKRVTIEVTLDE